MRRSLTAAIIFPVLVLGAGCAPQAEGGMAPQPRATAVSPSDAGRSGAEVRRPGGSNVFNPLETGGPAAAGGGAY